MLRRDRRERISKRGKKGHLFLYDKVSGIYIRSKYKIYENRKRGKGKEGGFRGFRPKW